MVTYCPVPQIPELLNGYTFTKSTCRDPGSDKKQFLLVQAVLNSGHVLFVSCINIFIEIKAPFFFDLAIIDRCN